MWRKRWWLYIPRGSMKSSAITTPRSTISPATTSRNVTAQVTWSIHENGPLMSAHQRPFSSLKGKNKGKQKSWTKEKPRNRHGYEVFGWRWHPDLNRGMRVLQTLALPLGYVTKNDEKWRIQTLFIGFCNTIVVYCCVKVNKPSFNFMFFWKTEMNLRPIKAARRGCLKPHG